MRIISAVPNNIRFFWETAVFLNSLKQYDLTYNTDILVFLPDDAKIKISEWNKLEESFPEVKFHYFEDKHRITRLMGIFKYIPLFRKYVLQEFFKANPKLQDEVIFYTDTDVLLNSPLDFTPYLTDDINYVSWTGSKDRGDNYLWQPYFDGKINQVSPNKLESYKKLDVLGEVAKIGGITREIVTANNPNTGGAQYILKNIDHHFWTKCFNNILEIKTYLTNINQTYMVGNNWSEKENNGIQAFCSDMWAVLYSLWAKGAETRTPKELDFAWSTDPIERLSEVSLLHNAGVTSESSMKVPFEKKYVEMPLFYKGKYVDYTPFQEIDKLKAILDNPITANYCNSVYIKNIISTKQNLKL